MQRVQVHVHAFPRWSPDLWGPWTKSLTHRSSSPLMLCCMCPSELCKKGYTKYNFVLHSIKQNCIVLYQIQLYHIVSNTVVLHSFIHLFIQATSIAPLQVDYYSEALPTQHRYCVGVSHLSTTGNCK